MLMYNYKGNIYIEKERIIIIILLIIINQLKSYS